MKINNRHKNIKNLIVVLLLGLFLWSNYGINFTHHHHKKTHLTDSKKVGEDTNDCLVCSFQGQFYEPLTQKDFEIKQYFLDKSSTLFFESEIILTLEFISAIQQRGPPVFS